jgi:predicted metalloendopeptidase
MARIRQHFCSAIASSVLMVGGSATAQPAGTPAPDPAPALVSGIDLQYIDDTVRAQDDLYLHTNGKWLAHTEIPSDKGSYDVFDRLEDESREQLRGIVEKLQTVADPTDPDQRKIADLYTSFMDEATVEKSGLVPLRGDFARIDAMSSPADLAALIAYFNRIGVVAPFTPQVHLDARNSEKVVFDIGQDGLGMPDRDYYLKQDAALRKSRARYVLHIERMLALAGDQDAAKSARDILSLETALAKSQWTKVQNRDPQKTYNKVEFAKLPALTPGYDWKSYLVQSGVEGKVDYLVVSQPSYLRDLGKLLRSTPLASWKKYFRWHLLSDSAPFMGKAFVDENFDFYGTALRDVKENEARWKRGIRLVDASIGEGLGRLYVAQYFPPAYKVRMEQLVRNLLAAYRLDMDTLDWMGPETRKKAQAKLGSFTTKIGYPNHWRDYGALAFDRGDLLGNVRRARAFEYDRNVAKLGKPVDRTEWDMTPPTVNAYYNPEKNEIVFPAGILRPPFFNPDADDAVNYGAIGGIIGHEISHGFDDQGSQYDGAGNLLKPPGWFTTSDLENFKKRTKALVAQYAAYAPVPGYPVNGELTLGENIADNSGLAIAFKAYRLSLGGGEAPLIDGFTGNQRLFLGWVQSWRGKTRDAQAILWIKADPHSPDQFRGLVPEMNQAAFYEAFGVKPGDKMYLAPEKRVSLW